MSLRELNQILLLEKGTGFEKYNKGNDSIMSLIDFYLANEKGLTPIRKDKVFNKILELLAINTNIYLSMTNSDEAKQEFLKFERLVKDKDNAFSQQVIGKKRKLLLKFPFLFSTLSKVSRH